MTGDITRWLLIAADVRREEFTASICSAARCDWPPEDDLIAIKRRVCVRVCVCERLLLVDCDV